MIRKKLSLSFLLLLLVIGSSINPIKSYAAYDWTYKYEGTVLPTDDGWTPLLTGDNNLVEIVDGVLHTKDGTNAQIEYKKAGIIQPGMDFVVKARMKIVSGGFGNITMVDTAGNYITAQILPDRISAWDGSNYFESRIDFTQYRVILFRKNGTKGWQIDVDGTTVLNGTNFRKVSWEGLYFSNAHGAPKSDMYWDYLYYSTDGVPTPLPLPSVPLNLTAKDNGTDIALNWDVVSGPAIKYTIKRSLEPSGNFVTIADNISGNTYTDKDVKPNVPYYYTVVAVNPTGESGKSNVVSAKVTASRAILRIQLVNENILEYDVPYTTVGDFVSWFENRSGGSGKPFYTMKKEGKWGPFTSRKDYIVFNHIVLFEISEYQD